MMQELLPRIYALILLAETVWLTQIFLTDPPDSSDPFSVALGWGGLVSMVVMLIYSVARRSKALRRIAPLKVWLHFHIFCGVQGVLLVFFHCWPMMFERPGPIRWLNPGVLNALAVLVVFLSGLFGRYLYAMVPHSLSGEQLVASQVDAELATLVEDDWPPDLRGVLADVGARPRGGGLLALVRADWETRSRVRALSRLDLSAEVRALAERRLRLDRRLAALSTALPWFELWIVAHRPVAAIMYVLSAVHVTLAYMFGAG